MNDKYHLLWEKSKGKSLIGPQSCEIFANNELTSDYQLSICINKILIKNNAHNVRVFYPTNLSDDSKLYYYASYEFELSINTILILLNLESLCHWALIIIDLEKNKTFILDSTYKNYFNKIPYESIVRKSVFNLLQLIFLIKTSLDIKQHEFHVAYDAPQ